MKKSYQRVELIIATAVFILLLPLSDTLRMHAVYKTEPYCWSGVAQEIYAVDIFKELEKPEF